MESFLNWKWGDFVPCCDAIIGPWCQHFGNVVHIKVGIHIAMKCLLYHVIFILPFILPLQSKHIFYFLDFL